MIVERFTTALSKKGRHVEELGEDRGLEIAHQPFSATSSFSQRRGRSTAARDWLGGTSEAGTRVQPAVEKKGETKILLVPRAIISTAHWRWTYGRHARLSRHVNVTHL